LGAGRTISIRLSHEDALMTATHKARYCRCGVRLARDNSGSRCSACVTADRDRLSAAPEVPADFWDEVVLRQSLTSRHMGRIIRAWRTHPYHGRRPINQDQVASWVGITQAQLSRIENGPPPVHLDRLIQWARVLRIPEERLWFALPGSATDSIDDDEESVKRRGFLAGAGATVASALLPTTPAASSFGAQHAVEWFAWHLWQHRANHLHKSQVPDHLAARIAANPHVVVDGDGFYQFTDPALVDVLVAQRVFGDIASGSSQLLATAQTSHSTDLTIGTLAGRDERAARALGVWMRQGATAVLRVNAAGVLAKVGAPDLGDAAISALQVDHDVRHLYLTAVASRVLHTPWDRAGQLAAAIEGRPGLLTEQLPEGQGALAARQLAAELANNRDAAARWCSAALLAGLSGVESDLVHAALGRAVRNEVCRENLRAYAAVLGGVTPVAI
jgi:transcriptional regulator with XRE-family HTH domain